MEENMEGVFRELIDLISFAMCLLSIVLCGGCRRKKVQKF